MENNNKQIDKASIKYDLCVFVFAGAFLCGIPYYFFRRPSKYNKLREAASPVDSKIVKDLKVGGEASKKEHEEKQQKEQQKEQQKQAQEEKQQKKKLGK